MQETKAVVAKKTDAVTADSKDEAAEVASVPIAAAKEVESSVRTRASKGKAAAKE